MSMPLGYYKYFIRKGKDKNSVYKHSTQPNHTQGLSFWSVSLLVGILELMFLVIEIVFSESVYT